MALPMFSAFVRHEAAHGSAASGTDAAVGALHAALNTGEDGLLELGLVS